MAKDRLDGTKKKHFLIEFFLVPGRVILWINYMMPGKGYSAVRQSARNARSPIMTFIYSIGFWAILGYSIHAGWASLVVAELMSFLENI